MNNIIASRLLLQLQACILLLCCFSGCQPKKGIEPTEHATQRPTKDQGKHLTPIDNPRGWGTYPALVLVAAKHSLGVDTAALLVQRFDSLFEGNGVDIEAQLPAVSNTYLEDLPPPNLAQDFFKTQARAFGLSTVTVATVISDFYLLAGGNRDFPEPSSNEQP